MLRMQGDHHAEPDRPVRAEALVMLGRVTAAARDGRRLRIDAWWQRWWFTSPLHQGYLALRRQGNRQVLYRLQGSSAYAALARACGRGVLAGLQERRRPRQDGTAIQLCRRGRVIAEVLYHPQSQTLAALWVRWPYRRLGLARRLSAAVLEEARRQGAPRVRLRVHPANRAALRLYRGLGFQAAGEAGSAAAPALLLERRLTP